MRKLPDMDFYLKNGGDPRAVYNYWQTSFHTEDPEEAAEEARKTGLEVESKVCFLRVIFRHFLV